MALRGRVSDFEAIKKKASLRTSVVSLCLAGEMVSEIAVLQREYEAAPKATNLGDSTRRELAERIAELQERMREATVDFHLRALPARVWTLFWASGPTRKENESAEDWDARSFPWYADMVSRTCIDPVMNVEQVGELVDLLHQSAWSELAVACMAVNTGGTIDVPNFDAASDLIPSSEQT